MFGNSRAIRRIASNGVRYSTGVVDPSGASHMPSASARAMTSGSSARALNIFFEIGFALSLPSSNGVNASPGES